MPEDIIALSNSGLVDAVNRIGIASELITEYRVLVGLLRVELERAELESGFVSGRLKEIKERDTRIVELLKSLNE